MPEQTATIDRPVRVRIKVGTMAGLTGTLVRAHDAEGWYIVQLDGEKQLLEFKPEEFVVF